MTRLNLLGEQRPQCDESFWPRACPRACADGLRPSRSHRGRPRSLQIWGLSSFGQQGVERVIDVVNDELKLAMVKSSAFTS